MKNVIIVNQFDLVMNFAAQMQEMLRDNFNDGVVVEEHVKDIENFSRDLSAIASKDSITSGAAFKRLFKDGFTLMIMNPDDFEKIENYDAGDLDYQVAIFDDKGFPVCLIQKADIVW
jgi:hypothetical protein